MNNNQDKKLCYVFSLSTAESALEEWLKLMINNHPSKEEIYRIAATALHWFLDHILPNASIYMFTQDDLLIVMEEWKEIQIESYPKQKKRIDETCSLLIEFFNSETVYKHKMIIDA